MKKYIESCISEILVNVADKPVVSISEYNLGQLAAYVTMLNVCNIEENKDDHATSTWHKYYQIGDLHHIETMDGKVLTSSDAITWTAKC